MPTVWVFLVGIAICGNAGGQTQPDNHGDTIATATTITLNTSITGVLHMGDVDYFELEISSTVDVSIFTEGNTFTVGRLFDDSPTLLVVNGDLDAVNFLIRSRLPPGTYYIRISLNVDIFLYQGPYTLTVQTDDLTDMHGDTPATATTITLGTLGTSIAGELYGGNVDYFAIEVSSTVDVIIFTESTINTTGSLYDGLFSLVAFNDDQISPLQRSRNFYILDRLYPGSTYYIEVRGFSSFSAGEYTLTLQRVNYTPFACPPSDPPSGFNDPLYDCQWHLKNTGQDIGRGGAGVAGEDINIERVWETYKGEGVHVAVVDEGLHSAHEDLKDNVDTTLNYDYTPDTPLIYNQVLNHGTAVGGLIAARDENGLGVRGVAPRATISGHNLLDNLNMANEADAMTRNSTETFVSNNSWGTAFYSGTLNEPGRLWEMAIDTGVNEGADGKGIVYVWSAGNDARVGDNSNYEGYTNYYAVTAVCAVNNRGIRASYSELGANLWVCAPGGYGDIATTDNAHRYIDNFDGTSASAPIVSGVVALVRQANPKLSWRDVKLILAASARQNDSGNSGWEAGAYQYQSASGRYMFNHEYGFGVVDAQAAVDLAQDWRNVPLMNTTESAIMLVNQIIPDNSTAGITHSLEIASDIEFIEFVEINIDFEHQSFADLYTELISPAGAISALTVSSNISRRVPISGLHRLGSAKHLGEDPSGIWQLRVSDRRDGNEGTLEGWSLKIYGHSVPSLIVTTSEQLTELNLHRAEIVLTLDHVIWEEPLERNAFSLNGAPMGMSIDEVTRDSNATATLTLAFDGTDFDNDMAIGVTVLATAHSGSTDLGSHLITITANDEASGAPSITGTPQVGIPLTAARGSIADGNGINLANYEWQWQVSADGSMWTDIPGADTAEFIPELTHQGKFLRVMVSFTDRDGFRESSTSTATAAVLAPPSVTVFTEEPLTELNLNGATLTLVITGASWETTLQAADFSLVDAPLGVGITAVERDTDTTAILTVEFDGTDFDDNTAVSVQTSNTAIAEYMGAMIVSTGVVDILANDVYANIKFRLKVFLEGAQ